MTEVPGPVDDWVNELTASEIDDVVRLLQRRADDKRRREWQTDDTEEVGEESEPLFDGHGDPLPEGVPTKATLTKKTINDNEYWYWQWRADDGTVTSKYKSPVNQD